MDHLCINISFICVQNTVLTSVEPTDKCNASQCQSGMSQTQRIVIMYFVPAVLLSFPTFLCLSAEQRCHSQTESVASVRGGLLTTLRHRNDTWRHSVDTTNISHTDYFARTSHDAWRHSVDTTNTSHTVTSHISHDAARQYNDSNHQFKITITSSVQRAVCIFKSFSLCDWFDWLIVCVWPRPRADSLVSSSLQMVQACKINFISLICICTKTYCN